MDSQVDLGISCYWSGFLLSSLLIFLVDNDVGLLQGLTVFAEKRIRQQQQQYNEPRMAYVRWDQRF